MAGRGRPRKSEEEKKANRNAHARANYHKVRDYRGEKIRCECGAMVSRAYISEHKKKSKHKDALEFLKMVKRENEQQGCIIIEN